MLEFQTQTRDDGGPVNIAAGGPPNQAARPTVLAEQLDALAKLPTSQLRKQWSRLYKTQPPKRMTRNLLLLALAWKMQARVLGGLGAAAKRKLNATAGNFNRRGPGARYHAIRLKPGTKLVREWHGEVHEIMVLEAGFEWHGQQYRSLSNIAERITGAHWSGPRFFGLKPKPDNFARPAKQNHA